MNNRDKARNAKMLYINIPNISTIHEINTLGNDKITIGGIDAAYITVGLSELILYRQCSTQLFHHFSEWFVQHKHGTEVADAV